MGKKSVKNIFWGVICYILFTYVCLGGIIIIEIHRYVKYILFPWFVMETCVMIYYYNQILLVFQKISDN